MAQIAYISYCTPNYGCELILDGVSESETNQQLIDRAIEKIKSDNGGKMPFGYDRFKVWHRAQSKEIN